jgi:2-iminoacetate synthase
MFALPSLTALRDNIHAHRRADVERVLAKTQRLGPADLAVLLSPAASELLPALATRSAKLTAQRFGRTIQLYAPAYLSNFCANQCLYCGFAANNRIARRVLTLDEAEQEAMLLHERGFNHILLVSGEAPGQLDAAYLAALALRLRDRFAAISIEVQPMTEAEYNRLFLAGITGVAIYQETYDREVYAAVHPAGPKSDYDYRLATPARVAAAGLRETGIGVLLGLSDWRVEGLSLGLHLDWLKKNFWRTSFTVSFPRLRPAAGDFAPLSTVNEKDLSQLLFSLRIFDPDVGLILSTREEARFRDGMLGLGPTRYSAGSCTVPGGYGDPALSGEQFTIGDHRSLAEVSQAIRQKGLDPVRKDWDAAFQQGSTEDTRAAA